MRKWLLRVVIGLAAVWVAGCALVYYWMTLPPEEFAKNFARLPMISFLVLPFERMWNNARAGALEVGQAAPDFDLQTLDKSARIRLSSFRGERPVLLVFGSYT